MAYDEDLASRIRELIADAGGVSEQRMFGGARLPHRRPHGGRGQRSGRPSRAGRPDQSEELAKKPHVRSFEMRGREMRGWLRVDADGVRTKRQLEPWVRRGVAYVRSLPPKR
jgi:hypothetical protein